MVIWLAQSFCSKGDDPVGIQRWNSVNSTLIERQDVESTLNRSCSNVVCQLIGNYARILYFIIQESHSFDIYRLSFDIC